MPSKEADFRTKNSKNIKRKAPVYIMHGFPNRGGIRIRVILGKNIRQKYDKTGE